MLLSTTDRGSGSKATTPESYTIMKKQGPVRVVIKKWRFRVGWEMQFGKDVLIFLLNEDICSDDFNVVGSSFQMFDAAVKKACLPRFSVVPGTES